MWNPTARPAVRQVPHSGPATLLLLRVTTAEGWQATASVDLRQPHSISVAHGTPAQTEAVRSLVQAALRTGSITGVGNSVVERNP